MKSFVVLVLFLVVLLGGQEAIAQVGIFDTEICNLPPEPGNCYAYFPNYYYDGKKGKCRQFVYGGCGGNRNRFETIRGCEKIRRSCLRRQG